MARNCIIQCIASWNLLCIFYTHFIHVCVCVCLQLCCVLYTHFIRVCVCVCVCSSVVYYIHTLFVCVCVCVSAALLCIIYTLYSCVCVCVCLQLCCVLYTHFIRVCVCVCVCSSVVQSTGVSPGQRERSRGLSELSCSCCCHWSPLQIHWLASHHTILYTLVAWCVCVLLLEIASLCTF